MSKYNYDVNQILVEIQHFQKFKEKENEQIKEFNELKTFLKSRTSTDLNIIKILKEYTISGKDVSNHPKIEEYANLFLQNQLIFEVRKNVYKFNERGNEFYNYLIKEGIIE